MGYKQIFETSYDACLFVYQTYFEKSVIPILENILGNTDLNDSGKSLTIPFISYFLPLASHFRLNIDVYQLNDTILNRISKMSQNELKFYQIATINELNESFNVFNPQNKNFALFNYLTACLKSSLLIKTKDALVLFTKIIESPEADSLAKFACNSDLPTVILSEDSHEQTVLQSAPLVRFLYANGILSTDFLEIIFKMITEGYKVVADNAISLLTNVCAAFNLQMQQELTVRLGQLPNEMLESLLVGINQQMWKSGKDIVIGKELLMGLLYKKNEQFLSFIFTDKTPKEVLLQIYQGALEDLIEVLC